jgi:hypothetical protein
MASEIEQAGMGPLTDWLTSAVPAAILNGAVIPTRPAVDLPNPTASLRSRWRLRRGR